MTGGPGLPRRTTTEAFHKGSAVHRIELPGNRLRQVLE